MKQLDAIQALADTAKKIIEETPVEPRQYTTLVRRQLVVNLQNSLNDLGITAVMRKPQRSPRLQRKLIPGGISKALYPVE